jgi:hypothetical protein
MEERIMRSDIQNWLDDFVDQFRHWEDGTSFRMAGGVPGCRIPSNMTVRELGQWLLDGHGEDDLGDVDWYTVAAVFAVQAMQNADNSYSPDL